MRPPRATPFGSRLACGCCDERCFPETRPRARPSRSRGRQNREACASPTSRLSSAVAASATSGPTPKVGTPGAFEGAAAGSPAFSASASAEVSRRARRPVITANSPRCPRESSAFSISSSRNASARAFFAPFGPPSRSEVWAHTSPSSFLGCFAAALAAAAMASAVSVAVRRFFFAPRRRCVFVAPPAGGSPKRCPSGAGSPNALAWSSLLRFSSAALNAGGSSPPTAPPLTRAYST
mmetsp:Transcript_10909/g.46569  ORF Transcript_10909/g.46569 Transcript_10909/m.46569 type:complete len:237 (+) Transcript_10909:1140-1850(+)